MKRTFQIGFAIVYLLLLLASLVVFIKPGASIFYIKHPLDVQNISPEGSAFAYQFPYDPKTIDPATALLVEGKQVLSSTKPELVLAGEAGSFALRNTEGGVVDIIFSPSLPGHPADSGLTYQVYIRPALFSPDFGLFVFVLLSLGVIAFFGTILADPQKRRILFASPRGILTLWLSSFEQSNRDAAASTKTAARFAPLSAVWRAAVNSVLAAYLLVFMEWIFTITKPSFMDLFSFGEKVNVFFISGFMVSLVALAGLFLIFLVDLFLFPIFPAFRKYAFHFPASVILACLAILLIDNFTYTILRFGIADTTKIIRFVYGLGFIAATIYLVIKLTGSKPKAQTRRIQPSTPIIASLVVLISILLTGVSFNREMLAPAENIDHSANKELPNIILLSSDGLSASNMSVYGYERDTTPFLRELAKTSLVGWNHFTNSPHSTGSETALLTGKLPIATRVLFPPDTLQGTNMYQHLPGILKRNGYRTISLGVPYFVDANTINFKNAFDAVNCNENPTDTPSNKFSAYGYSDEIYFLTMFRDRLGERISHILYISDMENPYTQVVGDESHTLEDKQRIDCLKTDLRRAAETGQPLFAHVHLMGTHGEKYSLSHQVFSRGKIQDEVRMTDFYDDAILGFDKVSEDLIEYLKQINQYNNTIFVLYTDHSQKYISTDKIPLIVHFPNDDPSGAITVNTQNIDLAPTILDYINIDQPEWMEGDSLFNVLAPDRLIFTAETIKIAVSSAGGRYVPVEKVKPPFYQFGKVHVIQCQKWYSIDLHEKTIDQGEVNGYFYPCTDEQLDSPETILEAIEHKLKHHGFDLPEPW